MTKITKMRWFLIFTALAAGVIVFAPMFGAKFVSVHTAWLIPGSPEAEILFKLRLPRVLTAFVVGSVLALSGAAFQGMFQNPLATPFTLGVASGAALGSALYFRFSSFFWQTSGMGAVYAAWAGGGLAIGVVYGLTRLKKGFSTSTLLLAGVAVSFFFSSLIVFTQYLSGLNQSYRVTRWLMGSVTTAGYKGLLNILPFAIIGAVILFFQARELNLLTLGEDLAASRGVNVNRSKRLVFFAASLMVSSTVAVCGPIGFVGMMAPHACRLLLGSDYRFLLPASLLTGGIFLAVCDTLARSMIAPLEIPVGVLTALLGGPFFLWVMLSAK